MSLNNKLICEIKNMNLNINTIKRITCITGHFGSGKTEFAINYALALKELNLDVLIIDFDIVNPYFRTKDAQDFLKSKGIDVISPEFANLNIESPSLPPEVYSAFADKSKYVVFDVGGDEDGATALGFYHDYFKKEDYDMFFVLNERRLLTQNVADAEIIYNEIKQASRLNPTAIIDNTHLMQYTDSEVISNGIKLAENFASKVGLPIAYVTAAKTVYDDIFSLLKVIEYKDKLFPLDLFVGPAFVK